MSNKCIFLIFPMMVFALSCVKPPEPVHSDIVINELLPVNKSVAADQNGQYDDWIEMYNLSSSAVDISGYFLSDDIGNFYKWEIPEGTLISGKGYLIIWADNDSGQAGLHANFKLSSQGEEVYLSSADRILRDKVVFPAQDLELSFSRIPDGTGEFRWQTPTFCRSNNIPELKSTPAHVVR